MANSIIIPDIGNDELGHWQATIELDIRKYNFMIPKWNKELQEKIDSFEPERVISNWGGDGNNKYSYTVCPIKLIEPLEIPTIVEVRKMLDNSIRLILNNGEWIDVHQDPPLKLSPMPTDEEMKQRRLDDFERRNRHIEHDKNTNALLQSMAEVVKQFKITGKELMTCGWTEALGDFGKGKET